MQYLTTGDLLLREEVCPGFLSNSRVIPYKLVGIAPPLSYTHAQRITVESVTADPVLTHPVLPSLVLSSLVLSSLVLPGLVLPNLVLPDLDPHDPCHPPVYLCSRSL